MAGPAVFPATTVLTNVAGFSFPRDQVLPSPIVGGALSLAVLALVVLAFCRYAKVDSAEILVFDLL
jgi:hypothetical protein